MKDNPKFSNKLIHRINFIILAVIVCEFILKLLLIFKQKIGWDEFYFLSKVYSFQRGEVTQPFQTFHVHFLGWLPWASTNEVTQIVVARGALFLLFIISGVLLYLIARHFIDRTGALFAVFCWLSLSNIIWHGVSLRADSFCSFLFLLACFALLQEGQPRFWSVVAGIGTGISLLISLKAAIHVVALFALLSALWLFSSEDRSSVFKKALLFFIFVTLTFGFGFFIHQGTIQPTLISKQDDFVRHVSSKTIIFDNFFPRLSYFVHAILENFAIWLLFIVGIFYEVLKFITSRDKKNLIAFTLLVPLFSLLFYRNAFPYYYVFIMAPAILFCGVLPHRILQDFQKTGAKALLLIFALILLPVASMAGFHFFKAIGQNNSSQKELFDIIHKMFPEPVPYIDGCSAVASYPQVGFFMSTWGFENYLDRGIPIFRRILQEKHPQFLLADTPHLDFTLPRENPFFKINYDFFEEDRKILEENFVNYWGMIWVPGKKLHLTLSDGPQIFEILIPGPYIIDSNAPVNLDNERRYAGEQVMLSNGKHTIQSGKNDQNVALRWNKLSYIPPNPPPEISSFYGF